MNIENYNYLWTTEKDSYVLVPSRSGYGIINKREQAVLSISDKALKNALIQKMLEEGCKVYSNILEAYADI